MNSHNTVDEPNLSLADLEQIDAICVQFEAACCGEQEPAIEKYVQNADERLRRRLFRELLETEWEVCGAVHSKTYYTERLPEYSDIVGAFFHDLGQPEKQRGQQATTMLRSISEADTPAAVADVTEPVASVPVIAGYDILEEFGRGGMGVVYRGKQLAADRIVAVKMIREGRHADAEYLHRFRQEAEAAARLQHPHIVQIFEVGDCDGAPFFSLEYCEGGSLEEQLDGTPRPIRESAQLVETLARAMDHAHQRQVVHRDLKPGNVLFTSDGTPKITDFGLAKKLDQTAHTQTGVIVGTPSYMAPEQAGGQISAVGPAADVYALGAVFYELLTGRPPFKSETALDTVLQVLHEDVVPPARLNGKVPRDVETICLKCLHKESNNRYRSALALAEDLRRWRLGQPIHARPTSTMTRATKWLRRHPTTAALAVVSCLAVIALVFFIVGQFYQAGLHREKLNAEAARELAEKAKVETEKQRRLVRQLLYFSDVNLAARAWQEKNLDYMDFLLARYLPKADKEDLRNFEWHYLWQQCHASLLSFKGHDKSPECVDFSPDGKWLATGSRDGSIKIWEPGKGTLVRALTGHRQWVTDLDFSPDGQHLVSASKDKTVILWNCHSGKPVQTLKEFGHFVLAVAYNPNGDQIATGTHDGSVQIWNPVDGKRLHTCQGHTLRVNAVTFSPDGAKFASGSSDETIKIWDSTTGQEWKTLKSMPSSTVMGNKQEISDVLFRRNGTQLIGVGIRDKAVKVWDVATGRQIRTGLGHEFGILTMAISPDDNRLVSAGSDQSIKIWDIASGESIFLKGHTSRVMDVAISPDGRHIASVSEDGTIKLWPNPKSLLVKNPEENLQGVAWSPDGSQLVTGGRSADTGLCVWDTKSGRVLVNRKGNGLSFGKAVFSPTGTFIVTPFRDTAAKHTTVNIWDARTLKEIRVFKDSSFRPTTAVAVSPDGKHVATAGLERMILWDVTTGDRIHSIDQPARWMRSVAFSPDGQRLVTASIEYKRNTSRSDFSEIILWDCQTDQALRTIRGPSGNVNVAFRPVGNQFAYAIEQTVTLCDSRTGKQLQTFWHPSTVYDLAFRPDGTRLVTAELKLRFWDPETGQELLNLEESQPGGCAFYSVAFRPDGKQLASIGIHSLRVWNGGE